MKVAITVAHLSHQAQVVIPHLVRAGSFPLVTHFLFIGNECCIYGVSESYEEFLEKFLEI